MTQLQVVPRRRKSLAIVLIVLGPMALVAAVVCALFGAVALTWTGLMLDVEEIAEYSDGTVHAGDDTEITLFAEAASGVAADSCTVTGPAGESVDLRTDGVPDITQTQNGKTYEAFAWFEGYGTDSHGAISAFTIDCGDAVVASVTGVRGEVSAAQNWFIAAGVVAFVGVVMLVAGIWWLIAVVRYNRRMRGAFAD